MSDAEERRAALERQRARLRESGKQFRLATERAAAAVQAFHRAWLEAERKRRNVE